MDENILQEHDLLCVAVAVFAALRSARRKRRQRMYTFAGGRDYVNAVMGHESWMIGRSRMCTRTFLQFVDFLANHGLIVSPQTRVDVAEAALIFLIFLAHRFTVGSLADRFQRSAETISRQLHRVLDCLIDSYSLHVRLPNVRTVDARCPTSISRYAKYFDGCLGAIDGFHIPIIVAPELQSAFRNRKGVTTQNCLLVVNFEREVLFLLAGCEGCCPDSRLYEFALERGFLVPDGYFYLADAGFALSDSIITPYRGTRYHLKEFGSGSQRPRNAQEFFNLIHAKLRNVVERTIGILRERWKLLDTAMHYSIEDSVKLVYTTVTLHNFLGREGGDDWQPSSQSRARRKRNRRRRRHRGARDARNADGSIPSDSDSDPEEFAPGPANPANGDRRERMAQLMFAEYSEWLRNGAQLESDSDSDASSCSELSDDESGDSGYYSSESDDQ
jgi:hypothetical protein